MGKKDERRKKKKVKKAAVVARRRAKAATNSLAPKFDQSLPTTRDEIEAAMEALMEQMHAEGPARVEHTEGGKNILLNSSQVTFMKLQMQLFRVVFGREPSPKDPIFWDREREHEGVFAIDATKDSLAFSKILAEADVRPEIAYAMALTGMIVTEQNQHLQSDDDIDEWNEAIDEYVHQAETGVIPLTPNEFIGAIAVVGRVVSQDNVIPIGIAGYANTAENRMVIVLQDELGSRNKAIAAMDRMAALVMLTDQEEFKHLISNEGYSEVAVRAAASAEVDPKTRLFNLDSFRYKIEAVSDGREV
jgi:hypothetical protein